MDSKKTATSAKGNPKGGARSTARGLLVARTVEQAADRDHCFLTEETVIGREQLPLGLQDRSISRRHIRIVPSADGPVLEDLSSRNGTFLNGRFLTAPAMLCDRDVIRVGHTILVYHDDIQGLCPDEPVPRFGMAGPFYTTKLALELGRCTLPERRGLLLAGPTGTGKELAARAFAELLDREIAVQSSAELATAAVSSLFGERSGLFPSAEKRGGHLLQADDGVLFLDEAHRLPLKIQKSLLRIIEEGADAELGAPLRQKVDVRFVLASTRPGPTFGLASDLVARMDVVTLPPLSERPADIPDIFDNALEKALERLSLAPAPVMSRITVLRHESLMLDGLKEFNVRGLITLADRIANWVAHGIPPKRAVEDAFFPFSRVRDTPVAFPRDDPTERTTLPFAAQPESLQEAALKLAYHLHGGNVSAIERALRAKGVCLSRRRISTLLDDMNLVRLKKPRKGE